MDSNQGPPSTPKLQTSGSNAPRKFSFDDVRRNFEANGGESVEQSGRETTVDLSPRNKPSDESTSKSEEVTATWPASNANGAKVDETETKVSGWLPTSPQPETSWRLPGNGRGVDDLWRDNRSQASSMNYPPIIDAFANMNLLGMVDTPYANVGQFCPPMYGGNLHQWQDLGYHTGGGVHWRRAAGPITDGRLSSESSRDDLASMAEFHFDFEDRFRVDRRKLELLVIGRLEPLKENADEFFQRIEEETNSKIYWPSRMKIGAKTKKEDFVPIDPHVRVGASSEEAVRQAKTLIMEVLDTKTTRVTMKMDVSYTDHSHIIGKGGNTIRRVMSETSCHVHFPDSNRSNPNEKSNQVSIAGEMDGVEKARARVRELTPLIFCFDLPLIPSFEASPDLSDPTLKGIQDQYNVQVTFRQKQKNFHTTIIVVKGCEWEASRVKEATLLLIEHFCCTSFGGQNSSATAATIPVSMNMEISPIHHPVVLGKGNINLKIIMQRTKTTILFPDASDPNIPPIRKGSVTITGMINNVYLARQLLLGSLPLIMMFDLPDLLEVADAEVQKIQDEFEVGISIKPKQRQNSKSVMIKAQERNASGMYAARHKILRIEGDPVTADIPETYKLAAVSEQFLNSLADLPPVPRQRSPTPNLPPHGYNPYQTLPPYLLPNWAANYPPGFVPQPPLSMGQNFFGPQGPSFPSPMSSKPGVFPGIDPTSSLLSSAMLGLNNWSGVLPGSLPPNHPFLQEYALRVLNHISTMQKLEQQQSKNDAAKAVLDSVNNNNNNYMTVDNSPPLKGSSPRNSSPVNEGIGNLSNQLSKLDDLSESEKFFDFQGSSPANVGVLRSSLGSSLGSSGSSGGGSSGNTVQRKSSGSMSSPTNSPFSDACINTNGGAGQVGGLGSLLFEQLPDRRAPGYEMKSMKSQLDYDQKKLLATKAIQTKPSGEPRTPTPSWSGLGFSNSMPESAIRESLEEEVGGKRQNLNIFPGLMNVREETAEELARTNEKSLYSAEASSKAPAPEVSSPTPPSGCQQQFFRGGGWFGNSSALDVVLPSSVEVEPLSKILPTDDLASLLAKQGLAKYTDVFLRHEVDLATFATLSEQDLKEIGIQTFGARKKLLFLANKVNQSGVHQW